MVCLNIAQITRALFCYVLFLKNSHPRSQIIGIRTKVFSKRRLQRMLEILSSTPIEAEKSAARPRRNEENLAFPFACGTAQHRHRHTVAVSPRILLKDTDNRFAFVRISYGMRRDLLRGEELSCQADAYLIIRLARGKTNVSNCHRYPFHFWIS